MKKMYNEGGAIFNLDCAAGKCLAKNTKIKMFNGYVEFVQNLEVNQTIVGDDLLPRKIVSITSGVDKIYKINS